jgi:eukaryotic-like serine/threonine-protein kinase
MSGRFPTAPLDELRAALAGRYRLDRELGAGGMAVVYLARDLERDRDVALKVLRPELGPVAGVDRFDREIRLAARLVHPNILPVLDSGGDAALLWYTMPYVEGESLRARLDREKQLPLDEALRLTAEIADALGHAHGQGVLHRDIKPENILLASGHALVADFGIARLLGDTGARLTATGLAVGTPGYMSPEQSSGQRQLDARSDLYALASVCFEMLAGEPPFTGPTAQAVIARRLASPAPSVRTVRPGVPEAVDAVLRRGLAPVPADRFATTSEFGRALISAAAAPVRRTRGPLLAAGILAVLAVLAAGLVPGLLERGARPGPDRAGATAGIRVAVLPFRLTGGDSADRYLAEGITEDVTSALANLSGLRVIDRNSVTPYARGNRTAREIGAALGIEALIDGDVQLAGEAIRVRVRLVETATEEAKWTQTYDHAARDMFRVQSEVAARVAGVLRIQLAEREARSLGRPPTTSVAAYDAYLHALARARREAGRNASEASIADLTRAVQLDSTFATAWAELAEKLVSVVFLYDADPKRLDQADAAIRTALRLDSTVAMAWKARHDLVWNAVRGWHFAEALTSVRRAIDLQPSLVSAHNALGSLYFHYGFFAEAREALETALALDPQDGCDDPTRCTGFSQPRVARVLAYQQQFDSALAVYRRIPFIGNFLWEWAVVLGTVGQPVAGLALLDSARAAGDGETGDRHATRALLHAQLGHHTEALEEIQRAIASAPGRSHFHHAQFTIACAYARLGRKAEAVEWLRRTAANGMPTYPLFRNDPNLRALRGDPGYEQLMAELARQFQANAQLVRGGRRS